MNRPLCLIRVQYSIDICVISLSFPQRLYQNKRVFPLLSMLLSACIENKIHLYSGSKKSDAISTLDIVNLNQGI